MKRWVFRAAILNLFPILFCGCAAITARENDGAGRPYIGVRSDIYAVSHPAQAPRPLWPPFMALDIPPSFVVDTVCLPYDLIERKRAKTFEPRQRSEKNRKGGGAP